MVSVGSSPSEPCRAAVTGEAGIGLPPPEEQPNLLHIGVYLDGLQAVDPRLDGSAEFKEAEGPSQQGVKMIRVEFESARKRLLGSIIAGSVEQEGAGPVMYFGMLGQEGRTLGKEVERRIGVPAFGEASGAIKQGVDDRMV